MCKWTWGWCGVLTYGGCGVHFLQCGADVMAGVIFNVQNWLPFACYLLIGCVLGYNRDKARDDIKVRRMN